MKKFKSAIKGFTLVELLIVIGLLGAIALIVISAINPIEQANRARDTRFKADGGQLISAIDRYFTGRSQFPWMVANSSSYPSTETALAFMTAATPELIGVCGASCEDEGLLITTNELKTEFLNRDFIQKSGDGIEYQLMMGKESGASASVYACFIPLSKSVREKAVADSKVYTLNDDGSRTVTTACDLAAAVWTDEECYICIPE